MQLILDIQAQAQGLHGRVFAQLDKRLSQKAHGPIALALSGGGDSVALLRLSADWARARGRRLLALTVDHQLNASSADWTAMAGEAAFAVGANWKGLTWRGDKPSTGLSAAARFARHSLIAKAAREAGACVVLFAHTADGIAEADLMRSEGGSIGRLKDWSPSPVWPEGRGLMICRPLLSERRPVLRRWLEEQSAAWIEDPANIDLRYARSRARAQLAGGLVVAALPLGEGSGQNRNVRFSNALHCSEAGVITAPRTMGLRSLAAAMVCAGGGQVPPRGRLLRALSARLQSGETFEAVACGARISAMEAGITIMREAGEFRRTPAPAIKLEPGVEAIWDGRFIFKAQAPGWSVVPAIGRLSALSRQDRKEVNGLPAAARGSSPVLIRDGEMAPILADETVERRGLVAERLRLALDETTHEDDLNRAHDGAKPRKLLFSVTDNPDHELNPGSRTTEDLNEPA